MMRQEMTYQEKEKLKRFAQRGANLPQALTMLANWHAQSVEVAFSEYAAQWAAAEQLDDVRAIRETWPLKGPRMIADNCAEWGSFGDPRYKD